MAFGSFKSFGGGGRGGVVGQQPGGLSAMFLGLGEGLGEWAKSRAASELEEKRGSREDARALAERASRENIERWRNTAEAEREATRQTGETERAAAQQVSALQQHAMTYNLGVANLLETKQYHKDETAVRGTEARARLKEAEARGESEKSLAAQREAQSKLLAEQQAELKRTADRNDGAGVLKVLDDQAKPLAAIAENKRKDFESMVRGNYDPENPAHKAAKDAADAAADRYSALAEKQQPLRDEITKKLGYGPKPDYKTLNPTDRSYVDLMVKSGKFSRDQALGKLDNTTPEEREQVVQQQAASEPAAAPAPPPLLAKPAPAAPAPAPAAAAPGATSTSFVTPTGVADPNAPPTPTAMDPNAAQVASTTSPPPDAAIAPSGTAIAAPDATATPPDDQTAKWAQTAQELPQSPDGQGVIATLSRLADAKQGPVADKMRRAAEIQLDNQYPDQDNGGFIDYFLDQNAQSPAVA